MKSPSAVHRPGKPPVLPKTLFYTAALFILGGSVPVYAVPTFGREFSHRQPDGTRVTVRIWGDEFYRVVESLDGYTLAYDETSKAGCYARLSEDGKQLVSTGVWAKETVPAGLNLPKHIRIHPDARRAIVIEKRALHARLEREVLEATGFRGGLRAAPPNLGDVQAIVLLIDFSDDPATIPAANVNNYCNQVGYTGYGNNGSVRDYFFEVSDGALTYTNYVPPAYYRALQPKSYYSDPAISYGVRARELIIEALNHLNSQGFDFSQYDSNGDGLIDGINAFYAGFTQNAWSEGLWPHSSSMNWIADGVSTFRYQITDIGSSLNLGTFCHENGHMLCYWPDLYDYDYDSTGAGQWCLMAYYCSDKNPVEPCAYMKYDAGWANTTVLTTLQSDVPVPSDSNTIYKYQHPTKWYEYYLIENRQRIDRDACLNGAGLAIWHIDETGSNNNNQMTEASHFEATLVQADGLWHLENDVNYGDSNDLWRAPQYTQCTPATSPNTNWWDGTSSDLYVTQISASGVDMTFTYGPPEDCNGNSVPDFEDVSSGSSPDCNADGRPDECGVIDDCELDKLPAPIPFTFFGWSVAVDGDVALVGISQESCPAGVGCGSADVYRFDGTHWVAEDNLTAPVRESGDSVGWYVALDGDLAAIGAPGDKCPGGALNCGSVHLFRYASGSWSFEATVQATDATAGDGVGSYVSVDGDVVVAGAYLDDCGAGANCGSAYVFRRNGSTWSQQAKLVAPDAASNDWFGNSVSVSGNAIVVGADGDTCPDPDDGDCGAAYLFTYNGASWVYDRKITKDFGFGYPVMLENDLLVVGAPSESCTSGTYCGGAYVYRFDGVDWNPEIRLGATNPEPDDLFGRSIDLSGDLLLIGASGVACLDGASCGKAYVFRNTGSAWARGAELSASDATSWSQFGLSAAISGNMIMMGSEGAAYAFALGSGDCDCNGQADVCEVNAGTATDVNGNGVIDDCEANEPLSAPYPHDRRKNRYISFDPNKEANDGEDVAFKVELKALTLGSCNDGTGGNLDFCRVDRGAADCNSCVGGLGGACITTQIHCSTGGGTCTPTGATCINDLPNSDGSNVGQSWWLGPEHPSGNGVHLLVSEAFRKESTGWGTEFDPVNHPGEYVVHAGDCEIVPQAIYGVRAVKVAGGAESNELLVETIQFTPVGGPDPFWWADAIGSLAFFCNGDITLPTCTVATQVADCGVSVPCLRAWTLPNGSVNFDDVNAALTLVAPPGVGIAAEKTWVDLHGGTGDAPPNSIMNSSDLQQFIFGFGGFPYAGFDPADCPDVGTWP